MAVFDALPTGTSDTYDASQLLEGVKSQFDIHKKRKVVR